MWQVKRGTADPVRRSNELAGWCRSLLARLSLTEPEDLGRAPSLVDLEDGELPRGQVSRITATRSSATDPTRACSRPREPRLLRGFGANDCSVALWACDEIISECCRQGRDVRISPGWIAGERFVGEIDRARERRASLLDDDGLYV